MTADRASAERICALVIDREPTTLREVEEILATSLPRNAREPWHLSKRRPAPGVERVRLAFRARDLASLRADPDPALCWLDLDIRFVEVDRLCRQLLGAPQGASWPRGAGAFSTGKHLLRWSERSPKDATYRSPADTAALVEKLATLVDRPLAWDLLDELFGPRELRGAARWVQWGETSYVSSQPLEAPAPSQIECVLRPGLDGDPLVAAFGWHDVVLGADRTSLVDGRTQELPRTSEGHPVRVGFALSDVEELEPGTSYAAAFRHRPALVYGTRIGSP